MESNAPTGRMRYPRKRAVTACQLCRTRKTKCDNQRPSCRLCLQVGAACHYSARNDHSSFDPASLEIIDRLNRIMSSQEDVLNIVRGNSAHSASHESQNSSLPPRSPIQAQSPSIHATQPGLSLDGLAVRVPSSRTSPDNVLIWPVFLGSYRPNCLQDAVFSSDLSVQSNTHGPNKGVKATFQEDKVPELMERFFRLVHIKNPIIDHAELERNSRAVLEDGISWDERSCLVLLACALGDIAELFRCPSRGDNLHPIIHRACSSAIDSSNLAEAEAFFTLARRRLGILNQSIAAVQCYFLCGVFYMYTFRPLDAFQSFHQASVIYQVYSKSRKESSVMSSDGRTEQTLFWSCFKSECEILSEIDLPSSGVHFLDNIHFFPNPPDADVLGARSSSVSTFSGRQSIHPESLPYEQEQAWFYYLSEIALRQIGNRVLDSFYQQSFESWKKYDIPSTIQIANEFFRQLNEWYECLPSSMHFDDSSETLPVEELPYLLYIRLHEIRSWILRPFLFCAIHLPPRNGHRPLLDTFVAQSFTCHSRLIEGNSIVHRHHGTWYMLRLSVTSALCLLAARKRNFEVPQLHQSVELAIQTLRKWEQGAPGDIREARVILEEQLSPK